MFMLDFAVLTCLCLLLRLASCKYSSVVLLHHLQQVSFDAYTEKYAGEFYRNHIDMNIHSCVFTYIYIYMQRERDREKCVSVSVCVCACVCLCVCVCVCLCV